MYRPANCRRDWPRRSHIWGRKRVGALFQLGYYQFKLFGTNSTYGEVHSGARRYQIAPSTIPSITEIDEYGIGLWVSSLKQ